MLDHRGRQPAEQARQDGVGWLFDGAGIAPLLRRRQLPTEPLDIEALQMAVARMSALRLCKLRQTPRLQRTQGPLIALSVNPGPQWKGIPDRVRRRPVAHRAARRIGLRKLHLRLGAGGPVREADFAECVGGRSGGALHRLDRVESALMGFTVERDYETCVASKQQNAWIRWTGFLRAAAVEYQHETRAHRVRQQRQQ